VSPEDSSTASSDMASVDEQKTRAQKIPKSQVITPAFAKQGLRRPAIEIDSN